MKRHRPDVGGEPTNETVAPPKPYTVSVFKFVANDIDDPPRKYMLPDHVPDTPLAVMPQPGMSMVDDGSILSVPDSVRHSWGKPADVRIEFCCRYKPDALIEPE